MKEVRVRDENEPRGGSARDDHPARNFEERLELFVSICRDVYALALGAPRERIANADIALRLEQLAERVEPQRVAAWVEAIDALRRQLRQNVNRQLALEAVLLGFSSQ